MHCKFGLIVTGQGEKECLAALFKSLAARANCVFTVESKAGQRSPISSPKQQLRMVGKGMIIPTEDERLVGMPARRFLRGHPEHFIILVDDLENGRREIVNDVFSRYRLALDTMLQEEERKRASVHFLANMIEAYYFADSAATNRALGTNVLNGDYDGDVEDIPHPKGNLKALFKGFDERADAARIVPLLDLDHILSRPETCAYLRALFGWCVARLLEISDLWDDQLEQRYRLADGICTELTRNQTVPCPTTNA